MSKSRKDQRKHRRKVYNNGVGVKEHQKREKRRKRDDKAASSQAWADRQLGVPV